MNHELRYVVALIGVSALVAGCATVPQSAEDRSRRENAVAMAMATAKEKDPGLKTWFDEAYGYAVFPSVAKGGLGVGGAYGEGQVFEQGKLIGYASLVQATVGLQFGGQAYTEIIFFKDEAALERFTGGNFELGAQASVVAITVGASADADYSGGVAVFTQTQGGLMYEASVGGQKFDFREAPAS